ncbi:NFACT RNA binding domain-containing protein [Deferrisoma sp.]
MDPWVVARIGAEIGRDWRGAWVQAAWASPEWGAVLRLRTPGRTGLLGLFLEPPGVGLLEARPPAPPRPPGVAAYLRAHAVGGRLEDVGWARFDRVLWLSFRRGDDGCRLVWEAAGRAPALLALGQDGRIGAILRSPAGRTRQGIAPGRTYEPPPVPEGMRFPDECPAEEVLRDLESGTPIEKRLFGFTPALARELERRLREGDAAAAWARWLGDYGRPGPLWEYPDGLSAVERTGPSGVRWESALAAGGSWLARRLAAPEPHHSGARAGGSASKARKRIERRIRNIEGDLAKLPDPAELRRRADALAANLNRVRAGAERAVLPDPWTGGEVELELDPALSPAANLERLYRAAAKAERAREILIRRLGEARGELARLGDGAETPEPGRPARTEPGRPYARYRSSDGWEIWVGRNGRENDRLVREARPWDLWLHARDAAGAHVLVRLPGRDARCPERTLLEAAGLAALRSRRFGETAVEVMVVEAGRLRKPKGAAPGQVLVHGERTVRVRPGWGTPRAQG